MGRYGTIETVLEMRKAYNDDIRGAMHSKYQKEGIPIPGKTLHRKIIDEGCALAENARRLKLPKEDIWHTLVYFGICLDSVEYHLDWKQCEQDFDIPAIREKVSVYYQKRAEETRELLQMAKNIISEDTLADIREKYRIQNTERGLSHTWHKIIVGRSRNLAREVIHNGGTPAEVRLALQYMLVCIDANKHQLDYMKFRQENGIVELAEKYGSRCY